MMAGGTGLYPFSDTIDLLYKEHLVSSGHSLAAAAKQLDPLVGNNPFNNFKFTLYIAVNELDELHPITLFQCNELAKVGKLDCHAKIKHFDKKTIQEQYGNIKLFENRFDVAIKNEMKEGEVSQFCVCGPTRFSKALLECYEEIGLEPERYRII